MWRVSRDNTKKKRKIYIQDQRIYIYIYIIKQLQNKRRLNVLVLKNMYVYGAVTEFFFFWISKKIRNGPAQLSSST